MPSDNDYFEVPLPELHSPEWHEARRLAWNASLVACLYGEHPYVSLADACVAKLSGYIEPETEAMARGTQMEPYVANWLADLTSYKLIVPEVMYGRGCLLSNPDRLVEDRPDLIVEIKTTSEFLRQEPLRYWWYQAQGQHACSPTSETVIIAALDASLTLRLFEIGRDETAIESILLRACEFSLCIRLGEMPEGIDLSADNVKTLWPQHLDKVVELATKGDKPLDHVRDYVEASAAVKHWDKIKKEARDALVAAIGPNAAGTVNDVEIATYKTTQPSNKFDMHAFTDDYPDLVAEYTKPKPGYRVFHIPIGGLRKLLPEVAEKGEEDE